MRSFQICTYALVILNITFTPIKVLCQNNTAFNIKGEINGLHDGAKVYLIRHATLDTIASDVSKSGYFFLEGRVSKGTEYYYLRTDTSISPKRSSEFLLINTNLLLKGDFRYWPKVNLIGSQPNDDYKRFASLWDGYDKQMAQMSVNKMELWKELGKFRNNNDSISVQKLEKEVSIVDSLTVSLMKERINETKQFIRHNLNSLYTPDLIRRMNRNFTLSEMEGMYDSLSEAAKKGYFGELLAKEVDISQKRTLIKEGSVIPNFSFNTLDGSQINILDVASKAEYTLIDFWASWCKPCRQQIPHLKEVYDLYKESGFNIVGLALSDEEKDWKKAILVDKTSWIHGRDNDNIIYKTFDIPAIPGYVLIDKSGRLISFSCSGSAIKEFGPSIRGLELKKTISNLLNNNRRGGLPDAGSELNSTSTVQPLKIGDKVPDIDLGEIIGQPGLSHTKISDYKGKLLILDFWSTWCSVCIAQFPKMTALQKQFDTRLMILPVGFDVNKIGAIKNFLNRVKGTPKELQLPTAIQQPRDSLLTKYFPFFGLPHEIWIDSTGTLIGITDHRAVTFENIRDILNGTRLPFREKKVAKRITRHQSFLMNNGAKRSNTFGVAFTGYIDTLTSTVTPFRFNADSTAKRYYGYNNPLYTYYKDAYRRQLKAVDDVKNKRFLIEANGRKRQPDWDMTKGMNNWEYDSFIKENLFAVEMVLPPATTQINGDRYLAEALDNYFNIESKVETRKVKCLALVRNSGPAKLNKVEPVITEEIDADGASNKVNILQISGDHDIKYLTEQLETIVDTQYPIIDGTGITGKIHLTLSKAKHDLKSIRDQLNQYGLDLRVMEKKIKMLVLNYKNNDN